jgi:hypothetical protein
MKIIATYNEISSYIKKNYNLDLNLAYISSTEISMSSSLSLGLVPISGSVNLRVVEMRKSSIDVKYMNASVAVKLWLPTLKVQGIDRLERDKFAIRFGQMEGLKEIFKTLQLKNFTFTESGLTIEVVER